MKKLSEWLARVIKAILGAFISSFGNTKAAEVAAVREIATIVVEEVQHGREIKKVQEVEEQGSEGIAEDTRMDLPIPVEQVTVIPGPTTFDKPVDQVYGQTGVQNNRKH